MKVDYINGKIVCVAENWKVLSNKERGFLQDCFWIAIWTNFDADGNLVMGERKDAQSYVQAFLVIITSAKKNEIAICDKVNELLNFYRELSKEEFAREERQRNVLFRKEVWESRKKNGCGTCRKLLQTCDDGFKCMYSGDELETKFYDEYNPITRVYEMFHVTGVPNEHCKDFVSERQMKIY